MPIPFKTNRLLMKKPTSSSRHPEPDLTILSENARANVIVRIQKLVIDERTTKKELEAIFLQALQGVLPPGIKFQYRETSE